MNLKNIFIKPTKNESTKVKAGHYTGRTEAGLKCEYWLQESKYEDRNSLKLVVHGNYPALFTFSNEGIIEKTALAIGILNEIQTLDEHFNKRVLIETETPGPTLDLLKNAELRAGILSLFDMGFKNIQSFGDRIEITSVNNLTQKSLENSHSLTTYCALLEAMITNKPISKTNNPIEWNGGFSFGFGTNSLVTIGIPIITLAVLLNATRFTFKDIWNPYHWFIQSLYFLPFTLIFVVFMSKKLGIKTTRGQHLRASPIYMVYAFFLGSTSVWGIDYLLPEQDFVYESVVSHKDIVQTKRGTHKVLWLSPVHDPADTWEKRVSESDFIRAVPNQSKVVTQMVRGKLGLERIKHSELVD